MRVVVRGKAVFLCNPHNPLEGRAELADVVALDALRTLGAAADDEMLGTGFACRSGGPLDPLQLLAEDVVEDEIGARVDGDELQPGGTEDLPQLPSVVFVVEQVTVEEFRPLVAGFGDLADGALDVGEGAIGELGDRGDADGISTERAPTI